MSHLKKCKKKNLIDAPDFVTSQLQYECIMGSMAYGVSSENSDMDIYGFTIPNKDIIFRMNFINGFDPERKFFEQYQQHHIKFSDKIEYDFCIYNITKYFRLVMENNPNMIDSIFVPERCITFITPIGQLIRDNRYLFLSKKVFHTFRGYSYQQLHKMNIKESNPNSKRYESIIKHGFDVKFGYHVVRLLEECKQILEEKDLDLERSREMLKSIRRGEWKKKDIENYFDRNKTYLEKLYHDSDLQYQPQHENIRELLITCLKKHFGEELFETSKMKLTNNIIDDIENILNKYR